MRFEGDVEAIGRWFGGNMEVFCKGNGRSQSSICPMVGRAESATFGTSGVRGGFSGTTARSTDPRPSI